MAKISQHPATERVTPFAEIQLLTQAQTIEQFVAMTAASVRLFAVIAKLILHLAVTVKAPQTVGGLLRKSGIRKTTIDNARQHARVFEELVLAKHITEAQFDRLTLAESITINRAMSGGAKEKQTGKKVAALMKSHSKTFDVELDCLARYGHSAAEQAKVEKAAAVEAEAKAKAAAKAEAKAPAGESTASEGDALGASTDSKASKPAAGKVIESGITKHSSEEAIKLIAATEAVFHELTPEEAAKALPALTELFETVKLYVGTVPAPRPRKAAKGKVVKLPKAKVAAKRAA